MKKKLLSSWIKIILESMMIFVLTFHLMNGWNIVGVELYSTVLISNFATLVFVITILLTSKSDHVFMISISSIIAILIVIVVISLSAINTLNSLSVGFLSTLGAGFIGICLSIFISKIRSNKELKNRFVIILLLLEVIIILTTVLLIIFWPLIGG